ncbi:hypothetical protein [Sulfurimonas sp. HSL3-7]|uniref:hypothetical protein n=1 Tax=Sulfonitrofixus jiaomeiensis TaxID=3131938 RepID=UPI0031F876C9
MKLQFTLAFATAIILGFSGCGSSDSDSTSDSEVEIDTTAIKVSKDVIALKRIFYIWTNTPDSIFLNQYDSNESCSEGGYKEFVERSDGNYHWVYDNCLAATGKKMTGTIFNASTSVASEYDFIDEIENSYKTTVDYNTTTTQIIEEAKKTYDGSIYREDYGTQDGVQVVWSVMGIDYSNFVVTSLYTHMGDHGYVTALDGQVVYDIHDRLGNVDCQSGSYVYETIEDLQHGSTETNITKGIIKVNDTTIEFNSNDTFTVITAEGNTTTYSQLDTYSCE